MAALLFVLRRLPLLLLLFSLPAPAMSGAAPRCHAHDKRVLLHLNKALGMANVLVTWNASTDCCRDWLDVTCDPRSGRVTAVEISFSDASGLLPAAVGDLPSLSVLKLRKNRNVHGPIPEALGRLTNLKELWLDMNHLTGPVPAFLGRMPALEYIVLSSNKLSGNVPPSLGDLPSLQGLLLDDNLLTGTIPESLGRLRRQPSGLNIRLNGNRLTGEVPRSFKNLSITHIDLSRNRLSGDPSVLFRTADLVTSQFINVCDLSRNLFEFDLSGAVFSAKLGMLDLSHNRIYGRIPAQLGGIGGMTYLDLSYNRLCGEIPQGGRLQDFVKEQFSHNRCLCGEPLPPCK